VAELPRGLVPAGVPQRGHDLVVAVLYPPSTPYYVDREVFSLMPGFSSVIICSGESLKTRFRDHGAQFIEVSFRSASRGNQSVQSATTSVVGLDRLLRQIRPDVVVTFEAFSSLSFQVSRTKSDFPYVHVVVCYDTATRHSALWWAFPLTRIYALEVLTRANLIVAETDRALSALESFPVNRDRLVRQWPGVYVDEFVGHVRRPSTDCLSVCYVGNLSKQKGVETLIEAAGRCLEVAPTRFRFTFVGDGPLRKRLDEFSRRFRGVRVLGRVSEERKVDVLGSSDVFVYPSEEVRFLRWLRWEEQTATSVLEAMASGLPVLGSNSGSLPEILGRTDVLFQLGSPHELQQKLMTFADSPTLREEVSSFNLQRARHNFDLRAAARNLAVRIQASR
jgi:glycosyltransferase involved in cell wall biosynthesis